MPRQTSRYWDGTEPRKRSQKTDATCRPRSGSDQREPSSPRFESRPPLPSGAGSRRGTPTAVRSRRRDTHLARQKRGAATARSRNHHWSRVAIFAEANKLPLLRGVF